MGVGAGSRSKRAEQVNFRLQRGIYALYADYELVYVGQTGGQVSDRLFHRLKKHRRTIWPTGETGSPGSARSG
jgi:hypothetical protein